MRAISMRYDGFWLNLAGCRNESNGSWIDSTEDPVSCRFLGNRECGLML